VSMSTRVIGFGPGTERWQKMRAVWVACVDAHIEPPEEVARFFDDDPPDPAGIEVPIPSRPWENEGALSTGYEVDVADIPEGVETLRFYVSF
jgi:hypothetical protein